MDFFNCSRVCALNWILLFSLESFISKPPLLVFDLKHSALKVLMSRFKVTEIRTAFILRCTVDPNKRERTFQQVNAFLKNTVSFEPVLRSRGDAGFQLEM